MSHPFRDAEARPCSPFFFLKLEATRATAASVGWFEEHGQSLREALSTYGAVYFHRFEMVPETFEKVLEVLVAQPFHMLDVVTPRSHVRSSLYTSTQAHPSIDIPQHQEMSYHRKPPHILGFYCEVPSEGDGHTPVNDLRPYSADAQRLFPEVFEKLAATGVVFVRNFNKFNFKSWQVCWETNSREEAEARLRSADTEWEWVDEDWLRTYQRRPAVIRDPKTGDAIMYPSFNIFDRPFLEHISAPLGLSLPEKESEQSMSCAFGDGEPIPQAFMTWVRERCIADRVVVPWSRGDFLLVDNMIAGHGRTPYKDVRRSVLASFRGSFDLEQLDVGTRR